jgi:hypothetical protein
MKNTRILRMDFFRHSAYNDNERKNASHDNDCEKNSFFGR